SGLPAYLRLVCDEIRLLGLHESLSEQLKQLPQTLPQLVSFVLARLETQCGVELVSAAACLLAAGSRRPDRAAAGCGARDAGASTERRSAVAGLGALLGNGGVENAASLIRLQGEDACRAVRERYLAGAAAAAAESFCHRFDGADGRALAELPYHLERSLKYGLLESLLTNLDFLKAKCTQGNPRDLLENYLGVANPNGPMLRERKKMEASQRFQDYKQFSPSTASTTSPKTPNPPCPGRAARAEPPEPSVWRNKDDLQPATAATSPASSPWTASLRRRPAWPPDSVGALAVGTIDGDVVLPAERHRPRDQIAVRPQREVTAVCFVGARRRPPGQASKDGFVNLWDSRRRGPAGPTSRATATCSPRLACDGFVLLRNAATGELSYHFRTKLLRDASVKLLDSLAHSRTAVLRGHRAAVRAVAFSRHTGGHLVSGSMDGELRVWDTATGVPVGLIRSAGLPATALMFQLD
uniref:WD_REPEATS_REGION domain-containing protein n=1 Tax=Macrostomum lignano TaxID=282301 RepID=A0A1I8FV11_9PLAT